MAQRNSTVCKVCGKAKQESLLMTCATIFSRTRSPPSPNNSSRSQPCRSDQSQCSCGTSVNPSAPPRPSLVRRLSSRAASSTLRFMQRSKGPCSPVSYAPQKKLSTEQEEWSKAPFMSKTSQNDSAIRKRDRKLPRHLYTLRDYIWIMVLKGSDDYGIPLPRTAVTIITNLLPLYDWLACEKTAKATNITLSHNNTIARNGAFAFGAIQGCLLDPRLDHVISFKLVDGIEFGVGVCNKVNIMGDVKRDFMCEKGGWGYYNYKTKHMGMKPKYPPGWYGETHTCLKERREEDIFHTGDILTLIVMREGDVEPEPTDFSTCSTQNLPEPCCGNDKFSIRFLKNGEDMGFKFEGKPGPLYLCLNFYFMCSELQILSDHKIAQKVLRNYIRSSGQ